MNGGRNKHLERLQRNLGVTPALASIAFKLYRARGELVTAADLMADSHSADTESTLKVQIHSLRPSLSQGAILNKRGAGYWLSERGLADVRRALTMPAVRQWQYEEQDIQLRKLWHDPKLSIKDIAEIMGVSFHGVKGRATRLKLPRKPKVSPELQAEWCPVKRLDDDALVEQLLSLGGFPAHEEERYAHRGYLLGFGFWARRINADFYRCLPLTVQPGRAA